MIIETVFYELYEALPSVDAMIISSLTHSLTHSLTYSLIHIVLTHSPGVPPHLASLFGYQLSSDQLDDRTLAATIRTDDAH